MSKKGLVLVESPTKARLLASFLGKNYECIASLGHIRDLPAKLSEVPKDLNRKKMKVLGVLFDDGQIKPIYLLLKNKAKVLSKIKEKLNESEKLLIATDEDREGESIGWHILDVLRPAVKVERLAFHEISKKAVLEALKSPREIDLNLVRAQESRRLLDRFFGYLISPVLWKKINKGLSAGRVQSVALRLLVEREEERMSFRSATYFDLEGSFAVGRQKFSGVSIAVGGKEVAQAKDFDPKTGSLCNEGVILLDEKTAYTLRNELLNQAAVVESVETKQITLKSPAPFVTSSLQQECSSKLNFSPKYTMSLAQKLYENGFITYMRTDSTNLSQEAVFHIRELISEYFGPSYVNPSVKVYKSPVKNAQEAHEAIRPTFEPFHPVEEIEKTLGKDAAKIYELILKKTLACQMKDATIERTTVILSVGRVLFRVKGRLTRYDGFLRAWPMYSEEQPLPDLAKGQKVQLLDVQVKSHTTQPPSRFSEGGLIRELEKRGIGRPSTWATIVDLVTRREYAMKMNGSLVPTFNSFVIVRLLRKYFPLLIDYDFTAKMEEDLDKIARGSLDYQVFLKNFFFGDEHNQGFAKIVEDSVAKIDSKEVCTIPVCKLDGKDCFVRVGKGFITLSDGEVTKTIEPNVVPDSLTEEKCRQILYGGQQNEHYQIKYGKYGRYLELNSSGTKKTLSLGWLKQDLSEELINLICSLPKVLGYSSTLKADVVLNVGRYGPYISAGSLQKSLSLKMLASITFEEAEKLLLDKFAKSRELGNLSSGEKVILEKIRWGYRLKAGSKSKLLKAKDCENLTFEEALKILGVENV